MGELPGVKNPWWNPFGLFRKVTQEQIATVHFSVVGAVPWDTIKDELETTFKLSPDEALEKVMPVTGASEHELLNMLGAAMQLSLPTAYKFEGGAYRPEPAKVPEGGTASVLPGKDRPQLLDSIKPRQENLGVDPFAQYRTAQALYQLVQLLNKSIASAKQSKDCDTFLLTLQMSLIPYAQNQPYDAYTDFALFVRDERPQFITPPGPLYFDHSKPGHIPHLGEANPPANPTLIPEVVPLLVTDNLEAASVSSASRQVRQFSLALAAAVPQIAGKGQFEKFMDQVDRTLGEDLNSLVTTARLSENIFRVRFGANRQGSVPYAMVPQTHRVFLLVMVPRKRSTPPILKGDLDYCQILAMTRLRHRESGKQVPMRDKTDLARAMSRAVSPLTVSGLLSKDFMKVDVLLRLIALQMSGDFRAFAAEVAEIQGRHMTRTNKLPVGQSASVSGQYWQQYGFEGGSMQHFAEALWLHISQVWSGSVYSTDVVELNFTKKPTPVFGYPQQIPNEKWALLVQPGKSSIVRMNGFTNMNASNSVNAVLHIKRGNIKPILVPAQFIQRIPPNIISFDFGPPDGLIDGKDSYSISIDGQGPYDLLHQWVGAKIATGASVSTSTKVIVPSKDGIGSFSFSTSTAAPGAYALQLTGATVESLVVEPVAALEESGDGRFILKQGKARARVKVSNLHPDTRIVLTPAIHDGRAAATAGPAGPAIELEVKMAPTGPATPVAAP